MRGGRLVMYHEEIEAYFRGTGVEPSYDGMELEF